MNESMLRRQNASLNLWENIRLPVTVYERRCENCQKVKSIEFNYNKKSTIRTVYACSLTCFMELQKK